MKFAILKTLAIAACAATFPASAFAIETAWVGARAGTGGVGGEIGVRIIPTIVVRGIVQGYSYDSTQELDGIDYRGTLKLGSVGAQVDFRPPLLPVYVTAGIFSNNNGYDLVAAPSSNVTIGSTTYTPAEVGNLFSKAKFDDVAYFGGVGLKFGLGPVEAALEGGIYYQGEPSVTFSASGPIANNPTFLANVEREKANIVDDLDAAKYWPMITLQARWKF